MAPPHVCVTSFRMLLRHMDIKSPHYHQQLATQCRRMHFMAATACGTSISHHNHNQQHQQQTTPAVSATILTARRSTAPRRHMATGTATNFSQNSWHLSRRHYSSSDGRSGVGDLISKEKGATSVDTPKETPPEATPAANSNTTNTASHTNGTSPKPSHDTHEPPKAATPIKEDDGNGNSNGGDVDAKMGHIKVADLKAEMRALGLGVSGNKQQLIQRLREYRLLQQQQQRHHDQQQQHHQNKQQQQHQQMQHEYESHGSDGPEPVASVAECMSPLTEIESAKTKGEVFVEFIQGLPHLTVPLPSRNEKCRFALMPVNHKVGDLIDMLKEEDRGIDRATVLNQSGVRIASTCSIESLMDEPFWLQINDNKYKVEPPQRIRAQTEDLNRLGDVRSLVAQLYEALHVNEYHISKEKELAGRLEKLQFELTPLEERKTELSSRAERRNAFLTWFGLGLMSVQFGILARLTWWEYSWDIMEPVTYFVTYGTTIAFYAYYCVTKVEYNFTDVKNREYLLYVHKQARKSKFDIEKYNSLKREIADVEYDLRRLRDPLNLQLSPQVYRTVADQGTPPALGPGGGDAGKTSASSDTKSTPSGGALKGFKIPFLDTKN